MTKKKIAYRCKNELRVLDLENLQVQTFADLATNQSPAWHPDGTKLVFGYELLFELDLIAKTAHQVSASQNRSMYPAWHPEGEKLCYSMDTDQGLSLCIHDRKLDELFFLPFSMPAFQPSWHPNGKDLAFVGTIDDAKHICIASLADWPQQFNSNILTATQLTQEGKFNHAPAWSPDGRFLAFESLLSHQNSRDCWVIMLLDMETRTVEQLTALENDSHHPSWSPNGDYILFSRDGENGGLFVMGKDGNNVNQLTQDNGKEPDWYWPQGE